MGDPPIPAELNAGGPAKGNKVHAGRSPQARHQNSTRELEGSSPSSRPLIIQSFNASGWSQAKTLLSRSDADIICLQELQTAQHQVDARDGELLKLGWKGIWSPSFPTKKGIAAGVLIACRSEHGIKAVTNEAVFPGRIALAAVQLVGQPVIYIASLYLEVSSKLGHFNRSLLAGLGTWLATSGSPWVLAGDWNLSPQLLRISGFLSRTKGTLLACRRPTFVSKESSSIIDFFVCSKFIAEKGKKQAHIAKVKGDFSPHRPVQMEVDMQARSLVTVLKIPPRIELWEVVEPRQKPEDWTEVLDQARHFKDQLGQISQYQADVAFEYLYHNYAKTMEAEITKQSGEAIHKMRGKAPELKHIDPLAFSKENKRVVWGSLRRPLVWLRGMLLETSRLCKTIAQLGITSTTSTWAEDLVDAANAEKPTELDDHPEGAALHHFLLEANLAIATDIRCQKPPTRCPGTIGPPSGQSHHTGDLAARHGGQDRKEGHP